MEGCQADLEVLRKHNHFRTKGLVDLMNFSKKYSEAAGPVVQSNFETYLITNQELFSNQPHYAKFNGAKIQPTFSQSHTKPIIPMEEIVRAALVGEFPADELSQLMLLFETRVFPEVETYKGESNGVSAIYLSELHRNPIVSIPKVGGAGYAERAITNAVGEMTPTKDSVYIPRLKLIK